LIAVHHERCAEKLAHKRQKEKEQEKELCGEEEMDLKERDKRKRYL
jgi:protein FRA10AC1